MTFPTDHEVLQHLCRTALGRMAGRLSIRVESVRLDTFAALRNRGLVTEHTKGLVEPTHRAEGYTHDPETFVL